MNEIQLCQMNLKELSPIQMQEIEGGGFFEWVGELIGEGAHYVYNWAKGDYVPAGAENFSGHVVK
jgi:hypothetical protein